MIELPKHEWDEDACCIHCGMDGADWPKSERLPPCDVWNEEQRAKNRSNYRRNPEYQRNDWEDWGWQPD